MTKVGSSPRSADFDDQLVVVVVRSGDISQAHQLGGLARATGTARVQRPLPGCRPGPPSTPPPRRRQRYWPRRADHRGMPPGQAPRVSVVGEVGADRIAEIDSTSAMPSIPEPPMPTK